ncbi:prolyl-tRNA synthetase [Candidatus Wolfebacteria bacterium]|nr:MAG: prolyl-tRNA synthetase [Candidatus Wolfebacteria bacterium]
MLQSKLFTKTRKEGPSDEVSKNAELLVRGGFIHKEMAGVYSYLPLGLRVIENIKSIIRDELNKVGSQEMIMTALQGKEIWEKTDRWSDEVVDNWFRTSLKNDTELGLAFTHEEPITNIMKEFVSSYRDLPFYAYQFQTKFRNELRAKSGLLRGREFLMKDLYSFSKNKEEHDEFYEAMKGVYKNIFERIGIGENTYLTMSNGAPFSKYSFEFQTLTDAGEDTIMYDEKKKLAINKADYAEEIFADFGFKKEDFNFKEGVAGEVGDIYSLGTKYSKALGLTYKDENGKDHPVYMGSYGIGIPRVMGTVVEIFSDDKGIIWPESVAPFKVHLIELSSDDTNVSTQAMELYNELERKGVEVLYDDRSEVSAGEKFADADLIGIPYRIVISNRSLKGGGAELKKRNESDSNIVSIEDAVKMLSE